MGLGWGGGLTYGVASRLYLIVKRDRGTRKGVGSAHQYGVYGEHETWAACNFALNFMISDIIVVRWIHNTVRPQGFGQLSAVPDFDVDCLPLLHTSITRCQCFANQNKTQQCTKASQQRNAWVVWWSNVCKQKKFLSMHNSLDSSPPPPTHTILRFLQLSESQIGRHFNSQSHSYWQRYF